MSDCSIYVDKGDTRAPDLYSEKQIKKSRKEHVCCECDDTISIGNSYKSVFSVYGMSANTYKFCLDCWSLRQEFEACFFGELYEELENALKFCNLQVEQSKIDQLTPGAKEKLLAVMDEIMKDKENE